VTSEEFDRVVYVAALGAYKAGDWYKAWRLAMSIDTPASRRLKQLALEKFPYYEAGQGDD
jgi:hypothetical protein